MNKFFKLRWATLLLALTLPGFCWGFPVPPTALIVDDGTTFDVSTVESFLSGRLTTASFAVTTNTGLPSGSLAGYTQIWDIRFQNSTPLSNGDVTAYLTYLQGGGSLFVMGENSSFLTRDNSIPPLITAAGGGNVTILQTGNSLSLQTVQPPFTGPVSLSTVTYAAVGGFSAVGNARNVTLDANGVAGGIVFPPGSLSNATSGTLITILDVNFLTSGVGSSPGLTDNMIAYLATPSAIAPLPGTPAPPTLALLAIGIAALFLWNRGRSAQV